MLTHSEENYLKAIYHLSRSQDKGISTNAIASRMETKASSVTDMIKKLNDKGLIEYQKYQGVTLTKKGLISAKLIVRNHRLWEVFLVQKLGFTWGEVHEVAEELEHIKSDKLISKLDAFLGYPTVDPHGDPIPNEKGLIKKVDKKLLSDLNIGDKSVCIGVNDTSSGFLQYLDKQEITIGSDITILDIESFDQSYSIIVNEKEMIISKKIADNLFVKIK